jgi:hypothetical protein
MAFATMILVKLLIVSMPIFEFIYYSTTAEDSEQTGSTRQAQTTTAGIPAQCLHWKTPVQ